jgi:hypothetical protein
LRAPNCQRAGIDKTWAQPFRLVIADPSGNGRLPPITPRHPITVLLQGAPLVVP